MQKVLVITVKGDHKYQFGIDRSVEEVLNEINFQDAGRNQFYQILDTCAIKISEIVSVEQFEYDPKEAKKDDKA